MVFTIYWASCRGRRRKTPLYSWRLPASLESFPRPVLPPRRVDEAPGFWQCAMDEQSAMPLKAPVMKMPPVFLSVLLLGMMKMPFGCGEHKAQSHAPAPLGTNAPAAQAGVGQPAMAKPLPVPETGPSVVIASPVRNEVVDSSDVGVFLKVQGLPADSGSHVHIMLDSQPPEMMTDPVLPLVFRQVKPGLHVVRAFESSAVPHVLDSVDPKRDMAETVSEMLFGDLAQTEQPYRQQYLAAFPLLPHVQTLARH